MVYIVIDQNNTDDVMW